MSVYFIGHGSLVKIGKSVDPASRVKTLQTGSALKLSVLAVAQIVSEMESYEIERLLHAQFAWSRRRGEFFAMSPPLKHLIAAVATGIDVRVAMQMAAKSCVKRANKKAALRGCKAITPPATENASRRRRRLRQEAREVAAAK